MMLIIYAVNGLAPFGARSLADITSYNMTEYVRAVIEGRQSAFYSFSGSAGMGVFARLSEYLFSPSGLLMALAGGAVFETSYDVAYLFKISLAAFSCAAFIDYRFFTGKNIRTEGLELKHVACVLLSVLYAFSSLFSAGARMTVTGRVFLPLILLGAYKIATDKGAQMFIISLMMNLIFSWYTGVFNMCVAFIWILFEIMLQIAGSEGFVKAADPRAVLAKLARALISLILALGASAFVWFTSLKMLPDIDVTSSFEASVNTPGICLLIVGVAGVLSLMLINNCGYRAKLTIAITGGILSLLILARPVVTLVAGAGRVDAGSRSVNYIAELFMVFVFAEAFLTYNNFSKRKYINYVTPGICGVAFLVHMIAFVFVPFGDHIEERAVSFDAQATTYRTLISAITDLDRGNYRIGFVSDDMGTITLLSSNDDYIYIDDDEYKLAASGDIVGVAYPYSVRYFVSRPDLSEILNGETPLGENDGYKVYYNPYNIPMSFTYDGNYFDMTFRGSDAETRLKMAKDARESVVKAQNVNAKSMRFAFTAEENQELFISVPAEDDMKVTLNGVTVIPKYYEGRFYTIVPSLGENSVSIEYSPDLFGEVLFVSIIAFVLLMVFTFAENFYDIYYPER